MTIPDNAPKWLKDADTENADVEIDRHGHVTWRGGEWRDGVWCGGVWRYGEWRDGVWRGGEWRYGEWRGGVWCGGVWRYGEWRGGWSTCNRAPWTVLSDGNGKIRFGCKEYRAQRWLDIADGLLPIPDECPARGTIEFRQLVASLKAQIAYDEEMEKI